jgi:hypothetical protein
MDGGCKGLCGNLNDGICMGICASGPENVQKQYDGAKFQALKSGQSWNDIPELEKNSVVSTQKLNEMRKQKLRERMEANKCLPDGYSPRMRR